MTSFHSLCHSFPRSLTVLLVVGIAAADMQDHNLQALWSMQELQMEEGSAEGTTFLLSVFLSPRTCSEDVFRIDVFEIGRLRV